MEENLLGRIDERTQLIKQELDEIKEYFRNIETKKADKSDLILLTKKVETKYVTKDEFEPIKRGFYITATLVAGALITAVLGLILA